MCNLIFLSLVCTAIDTLKPAIIAWSGGSIWKGTSEILQSCMEISWSIYDKASVSISQNAISTKRKELEGQQRQIAVWRLPLYSTMCTKRRIQFCYQTIWCMWLPVARRVVGGEKQRKGKEVKRRGGVNHVCSPPCTALSFLGRLVFVSLYPSHVAS